MEMPDNGSPAVASGGPFPDRDLVVLPFTYRRLTPRPTVWRQPIPVQNFGHLPLMARTTASECDLPRVPCPPEVPRKPPSRRTLCRPTLHEKSRNAGN